MVRLRRLGLAVAVLLTAAAGVRAQGVLPPDRPLSQAVLDTWGRADGLPQLSVTALAQTPDGFLWVGTQEGLARFDGVHFTAYDAVSGHLPASAVTSLLRSRDGALWVGMREGVARWEGGRFETQQGATEGRYVFALAEDDQGRVWAATRDGAVVRHSGGRFADVAGLDSLGAPVTALAAAGGALWIGTRGQGLWRWTDGELRRVGASRLGEAHVTALLDTPDGLAIGTLAEGLFRVRNGRLRSVPSLSDTPVRTLHHDPSGTLWIGTEGGGLARLGPEGRAAFLGEADGLPHATVRSLLTDHEGSLWVGTEGGGLSRLRPGKFVTWGAPEGLGSDIAFSIVEDEAGAVWVGTEGGGLSRIRGGRVTTMTTADGLPGDVVLALAPARGGGVWAGFHGDGLALVRDGSVTRYGPETLGAGSVFGLHADPDGTLWAATSSGLARVRDGDVTTYTTADGLTSDVVTAITRDARGRLLVGTYEAGLTVLDTTPAGVQAVDAVREADGLGSEAVISLLAAPDGTVWIGMERGGLARLMPDGELTTVRARDGLPSDAVLHILSDGQGRLWLSTNRGLATVREADVAAFANGQIERVPASQYDEADGLRTREFNGGVSPAGWAGRDGTLWFASAAGAVAVPPGAVRTNTVAPPVAILAVRADGEPIPFDGGIRLAPGTRRLAIDYTALSFIGSPQLPFRYRLDGVDDGWIEAGARREADYTNLAPGDYTFHVQAANADGVWSETPATLQVEVVPSLTQTAWFRVLMGLLFAGALGMGYVGRVRHLTSRQRELERLVAERTETVETEKARAEDALSRAEAAWAQSVIDQETIQAQASELADANGALRDANEQLAETSEVKSHLMRVVAHDLNNPLGVVLGYADVVREEIEPESEAHEFIDIIESAASDMVALVKRFLGAEAIDAGRLAMHPAPLDLAGLTAHVVAKFVPTARQKEQALTIDADEPAWVSGDRDWLKEVADNLISNAVKYTPPGRAIHVAVAQAGGRVQLRVQDEGPGLTAEDQAKLFGRFQRLSAQPTGNESSTGLGLSIVQKVVEMHGGRVWAESVPGEGATFIAEFDALTTAGDGAADTVFAEVALGG